MTSSPRSDDDFTQPSRETGSDTPEVVYHYTNTSALLNILKTRMLWATDSRFMNDQSEFNYGKGVVLQLLEEELERERSDDNRVLIENSIEAGFPESYSRREMMLATAVEKLSMSDSPENAFYYFSISFCEDGDLLSQWRGYAGHDGWAIGFDLDEITKSDAEISAHRVLYGDEANSDGALRAFEEMNSSINDFSSKRSGISYGIANGAERKIATLKHPAFSEEREWRLLVDEKRAYMEWSMQKGMRQVARGPMWAGVPLETALATDKSTGYGKPAWRPVQFRPGGVALTPYLEIPFPASALREVVVGPHPHQDLQKLAIERLLFQEGLDDQVTVKLSEAPFR